MKIDELESIIEVMEKGERIPLPKGLTVKRAHGMTATIGNRTNKVFWVLSAPDFIVRKK